MTDRVLHVVHDQDPPQGASPHWTPPAMDLQVTPETAERLRELLRMGARGFDRLAESMTKLAEALRKAGALPEPVPEEPRARALYLVQNRGTGPALPLATERRRRR